MHRIDVRRKTINYPTGNEREVRLLVQVRPAKPGESQTLTALCVRSKAHWGYDAAFMKLSAAALNVNEDDIAEAFDQRRVHVQGNRRQLHFSTPLRVGAFVSPNRP